MNLQWNHGERFAISTLSSNTKKMDNFVEII